MEEYDFLIDADGAFYSDDYESIFRVYYNLMPSRNDTYDIFYFIYVTLPCSSKIFVKKHAAVLISSIIRRRRTWRHKRR